MGRNNLKQKGYFQLYTSYISTQCASCICSGM